MSTAYDTWLAHDPREDGPEPFCQLCSHAKPPGTCSCETSPFFEKQTDAEDSCSEFDFDDPYDAESIGDRQYHERVDREEHLA